MRDIVAQCTFKDMVGTFEFKINDGTSKLKIQSENGNINLQISPADLEKLIDAGKRSLVAYKALGQIVS